jgi:hypothetical protein
MVLQQVRHDASSAPRDAKPALNVRDAKYPRGFERGLGDLAERVIGAYRFKRRAIVGHVCRLLLVLTSALHPVASRRK